MVIVAGHVVDPGVREAYLAGCSDVVHRARCAAGCLDFSIAADLLDAGRTNVFERWTSRAAVEAFRGSGPNDERSGAIRSASVVEYDVSGARSLTWWRAPTPRRPCARTPGAPVVLGRSRRQPRRRCNSSDPSPGSSCAASGRPAIARRTASPSPLASGPRPCAQSTSVAIARGRCSGRRTSSSVDRGADHARSACATRRRPGRAGELPELLHERAGRRLLLLGQDDRVDPAEREAASRHAADDLTGAEALVAEDVCARRLRAAGTAPVRRWGPGSTH
ncbi:putative quinol monooxygenase [Kineococcus esterisolvens]|uniref:putative quinol monooxygenase n=1 Tax=unclassified Kineococcus TaxID=2621656 RepID=UPI003D7EB4F0